jgi:hypothetical protein
MFKGKEFWVNNGVRIPVKVETLKMLSESGSGSGSTKIAVIQVN